MEDREILENFLKEDKQFINGFGLKRELKAISNILKENKDLQKSVDEIYADYQDIGKEMFKCSEENENLKQEYETKCNENKELEDKIRERLEAVEKIEQNCKEGVYYNPKGVLGDTYCTFVSEIENLLGKEK